jgi:metal-responsive CopG/Arc/MetJ family transcriptional regulator
MSVEKVTISIETRLLKKIDRYVKKEVFKSRSHAFQLAALLSLEYIEHDRLARECDKLDPQLEQEMANEGLDEDLKSWPKY